jgi:serine/threonine-protein kinase
MSDPKVATNLVGTRFGRYEVEARIASGGMAEVWQARLTGSAGFEKRVALKTLLPHLAGSESLVRLFVQEAAMAAELSHPNVVQVYDFGCKEGRYFMAMEYVQGRTLRQVLQSCLRAGAGHLPTWALLEVTLQVCDAIGYIHAYHNLAGEPLGLVHRDVSPENILVSYGGAVKLIDFGVAKVVEEAGRSSSEMAGKPRYMAPEQAMGLDLDGRADLFSLGVVLYECATGKRPFAGKDAIEILEAVVCGRAKPVLSRNPDLARDLAATIDKAMSTDRGRRHADAHELRNDLIHWSQRVGLNGLHHRLQPLMVALFSDEPDLPAALRKQRDASSLTQLLQDGEVLLSAVPPPVPIPVPPAALPQGPRRSDSGLLPLLEESDLLPMESSIMIGADVPTLPGADDDAAGAGAGQAGSPAAKAKAGQFLAADTSGSAASGAANAANPTNASNGANTAKASAPAAPAAPLNPWASRPAVAPDSSAGVAAAPPVPAASADTPGTAANRQTGSGFGGFPSLGGWTAPVAAVQRPSKTVPPRERVSPPESATSGVFAAIGTGTPSDFEILSNVRRQAPTWDQPAPPPHNRPTEPVRPAPKAEEPPRSRKTEGQLLWGRATEPLPVDDVAAHHRDGDDLPREAEALFEAGLLHYRRREWKQALAAWEKACALVPDHRGWAFNLARVRQRLAAGNGDND